LSTGIIRPSRFRVNEIIATIHAAGGVAILAHPTVIQCSGRRLDAAQIGMLVQIGLDGIEVYHHRLNAVARQYYLRLSHQYNLAVSGGSDEHGWPDGFPHLGSQAVTGAMVNELRLRARSRA
jgi:3',5'-nucleoside bisphosphate phosphatase